MTLAGIVGRNVLRNKFRGAMTALGVAVAVIAFVLLRTVLLAWGVGAEYAAKDRLSTRNKVSYGIPLPKRYIDDIMGIPGIQSATYCDWFGARWSRDPNEFFTSMACADNAFDAYPEIRVDPAALARWKGDRKGAIVGDMLARRLGWHVGDHVTLVGSFYPGDWEFTIDGIYTVPPEAAVGRSSFFLRWEYKNEGAAPRQKNLIGWIFTRVDDASRGPEISRAIDALFDDRDVQTATSSERSANDALLGGVSAVLGALDVVSVIFLVILTLILGNTISMGVRERTAEYGVLRAIGFQPSHVRLLIIGEALSVALIGGVLGLALALPLVQTAVGAWLEENVGQFFPVVRVAAGTVAAALGSTLLLACVASIIPAVRAGRMPVTEALRRVA